jgi:hypothetical protein
MLVRHENLQMMDWARFEIQPKYSLYSNITTQIAVCVIASNIAPPFCYRSAGNPICSYWHLTCGQASGNCLSIMRSFLLCCRLSVYASTALLLDLGRISIPWSFTQSVGFLGRGMSPSQGRYLHTQNKRTQTSMPQAGFGPTIPVFEQAKTVHALARAAGHCDRNFAAIIQIIALNGTMTFKWWIRKDLEGSRRYLIEVLFRHLPGETEKITINLSRYSRFSGRDSNRAPCEYRSDALPLSYSFTASVLC